MKKITIITNTFGNYHRQNVAVDSWRYLKQLFPNHVDILDIQFEDEKDSFVDHYPDIPKKFVLTNTQTIIEGATKKLPFFKELFSSGLDTGSNFIWTNSDVILTEVLIRKITNLDPNSLICSRLDIENINSFDLVVKQNIKPIRWEIAGVDTIYLNHNFASKYKEYFTKYDFVIGKFLFDCYLGGLIKFLDPSPQPVENGYPVSCFHLSHGISSVTTDCPERSWNLKIAEDDPFIRLMINMWSFNVMQNFARRTPSGAFMEPRPEERHIEKIFFSYMSAHRILT
jgi:hypothetical protein